MALHPCPACDRHVRAGEVCCPFCRHSLEKEFVTLRRVVRAARLTRAAIFFAGATATTVAACEQHTDESTFEEPDGASVDGGMAGPFYGTPPIDAPADPPDKDVRDTDAADAADAG
jgi:hypothetical protein